MSVDLQKLSTAKLIELMGSKKGTNVRGKNLPNYLQKTGSVFSAPDPKRTDKPNTRTQDNFPTGIKKEKNNGTPSASEGKAQAGNLRGQTKQLRGQAGDVKDDASTAKRLSSDAAKTTESAEKQRSNLEKQLKAGTQAFAQTQAKIADLGNASRTTLDAIARDQAELESLTAGGDTTVFSLSLAGDQQANGTQRSSNPNQERINEIAARLGENTALLDTNGQQIYSLQKTSNKTYKNINKLNTKYTKSIQNSQKATKNQQKENSKLIKIADKVSQISSTVTTAGQTLDIVGMGMIAAGQAMSAAFGAGGALIAAGQVCRQVGTVAQTVGQYGTLVSEGTKGVAFAAEGNLAGAMASLTSAAAAGQSAVKSTKNMSKTLGDIKNQAMEAKQNLAAGAKAKEAAQELKDTGNLNGMTKKQAAASIKENILAENNFDPNITNAKQIKNGISSDIVDSAKTKTTTTAQNAAKGLGVEDINNMTRKQTSQVRSAVNKATSETAASNAKKYAFANSAKGGDKFSKLASSIQTLGSQWQSNNNQNVGNYGALSMPPADPMVMARLRAYQGNRFLHPGARRAA